MPLEEGSVLNGRYEIGGQLGKGGMGAVYFATDQTLGIRVAVKENLNLNPDSERQFRREAKLLAELRHPHLPRVTDHFILKDRQYLVMDFIEGVDLHTRSAKQAATIDEVITWGDQVGDALGYLHARRPPVIHRDIKPANIKLQPDGNAVLVDFGIAKIFADEHQTETGARGMTPGFSPPEQYGTGSTDQSSDQYSLSATLYALLTGSAPPDSIERMLNKETFRPAIALNPAIPEHVDATLTRGLMIEKEARFSNMESFRSALRGEVAPATIVSSASMPTVKKKRSLLVPLLGGVGLIGLALICVAGLLAIPGGIPGLLGGAAAPSPTSALPTLEPLPTDDLFEGLPPTEAIPQELPPTAPPQAPPTQAASSIGGGGRIAFSSDREDGRTLQLWTLSPDATDPRQLTFGPGDKTQPKWSPDGQRLLFVSKGGTDNFGNELGTDIWMIKADGTGLKNVTHAPGDDEDPTWAPDGTQIAFSSDRQDDTRFIYTMLAPCVYDEGEESCWAVDQRRSSCASLSFCPVEYSPDWAPNNSQMALIASINGAPGRIFIGSPAGGIPEQFESDDSIIGADDPAWSPDGMLLAYTWTISAGRNEVYLVNIENRTADPIQLTNTLGNKEPAFSPDGNWIAFTSTRDQNPEIYLMGSTGANQINLTNSPGSRDIQADWQPLLP